MTRTWVLAAVSFTVALAALATAHGSEDFGGLVPCALCLLERWPWRFMLVFALAALVPFRRGVDLRVMLWGVVLCAAASAALAGLHVGVEHGWWPSPLPECAAPNLGTGSIAERFARMPSRPAKPCDDPTYLVPSVPLSFAALNGLASLAFGTFLAMCLRQMPKGADHEPNRRLARGPHRQGPPRAHDSR